MTKQIIQHFKDISKNDVGLAGGEWGGKEKYNRGLVFA